VVGAGRKWMGANAVAEIEPSDKFITQAAVSVRALLTRTGISTVVARQTISVEHLSQVN
jgi:hypothetical protein